MPKASHVVLKRAPLANNEFNNRDNETLHQFFGKKGASVSFVLKSISQYLKPYCKNNIITPRTLSSLGMKSRKVKDGTLVLYIAAHVITFLDEVTNQFFSKNNDEALRFVDALNKRINDRLVYKTKVRRANMDLLKDLADAMCPTCEVALQYDSTKGCHVCPKCRWQNTQPNSQLVTNMDIYETVPSFGNCPYCMYELKHDPIRGNEPFCMWCGWTAGAYNGRTDIVPAREIVKVVANVTSNTLHAVGYAMSDYSGPADAKRRLEYALQVYAELIESGNYGPKSVDKRGAETGVGVANRNIKWMLHQLDPDLRGEYKARCKRIESYLKNPENKKVPNLLASVCSTLLLAAKAMLHKEAIIKELPNGEYALYTRKKYRDKKTGKWHRRRLGTHPSRAAAERQESAIHADVKTAGMKSEAEDEPGARLRRAIKKMGLGTGLHHHKRSK